MTIILMVINNRHKKGDKMGFFDNLKKIGEAVGSLNEMASEVSKTTLEDYGKPEYSLYTALQLGELHRRIDITDEEGSLKYYTQSSIIAIKGKTDIMDAGGNVIAHLEKRLVSLHEKHFVTMADGTSFTLSNELLHIVKDITNIEGLGWQLQGNIIGLTFNLLDQNGQPVARVEKNAISVHDRYSMGIYQPDKEQIVVAIVIQLEKMIEARNENRD